MVTKKKNNKIINSDICHQKIITKLISIEISTRVLLLCKLFAMFFLFFIINLNLLFYLILFYFKRKNCMIINTFCIVK